MTIASDLLSRDFARLTDLLAAHAAERPSAIAVVDGDDAVSYQQLNTDVERVSFAFQRDGLRPRDVVAICAANSSQYVSVFLGALRAGLVVAPLATSSTPAQIAAMVADCGARMLFTDREIASQLTATSINPAATSLSLDSSGGQRSVFHWWGPVGAVPAPAPVGPDDAFNIIYSSGTTGTPKGIVQSHAMRWSVVSTVGAFGYDQETVNLVSTPLYSNTTLVSLFPTLGVGGKAVLMRKFDARRFLELSQQHRATHAMLVPVQYRRLMAVPDFGAFDLSSYRMKFSTSAPFAAELKADILARWPGGLVEYYGMTEGGGVFVLVAHEHPDKLHTVGRPASGHEIRLIDEEGREVAPGETGEVVGRSPGMMFGYHNQPGKTADAEWRDAEGRRFIRTGDVARFDEDGFLILLDRKKDMIISGGFNIYPSDVEAIIGQHPDVHEVAVVGVPSDRWGELPVAFVALKPGAIEDARSLGDFVDARVSKVQRPAAYRFLGSLPRSGIGKVLKRELRDLSPRLD